MHKPQKQVLEFHEKFGCYVGKTPKLREDFPYKHRLELMLEELLEIAEASGGFVLGIDDEGNAFFTKDPSKTADMGDMIDDLCDLLYVTYGTLVSMGVNVEPFFDCVHASNMTKVWPDGTVKKDKNGKILKPPTWVSPDDGIQRLLGKKSNT